MFPEDFPGLPPERVIEFAIQGATPASITVLNGSSGVKRIEALAVRIVRERIYSSECITMGSSSALCQEERWYASVVC